MKIEFPMATKRTARARRQVSGEAPENPSIYQLRMTLLGTAPPIWRRLLVPAGFTLAQLHNVLQIVMGWQDMHLHEFRSGQRHFGRLDPDDPFPGTPPLEDERKMELSAVLPHVDAKLLYIYDFGDYWKHEIVREQLLPAGPEAPCPICVNGERACPPEDCGGIYGYEELLEVLAKPKHRRHRELREWAGAGFDPGRFSIADVNRRLAPSRHRPKVYVN